MFQSRKKLVIFFLIFLIQISKFKNRNEKSSSKNFKIGFYALFCDSSFKNKLAKIEVDLVNEKILKWETLTDFDGKDIFQQTGKYELCDLQEYLNEKLKDSSNSFYGSLVLNYTSLNKIALIFTIKNNDLTNFNNSELIVHLFLNTQDNNWDMIIKSENHNYEESGQIMRHSKEYSSKGNNINIRSKTYRSS